MANYMFSSMVTGTNNALSSFISQSLGGRSTAGDISGLAGMISDYSSLKNGSYGKLMKAYYTKDAASVSKTGNTTSKKDSTGKTEKSDVLESLTSSSKTTAKKADKTSADAAKKLVDSASALDKLTYKADNMDKIADSVEAFVKDYNSALKAASDSNVTSVKQNGSWMASTTKANEKMLASVGVKINEDNTLSLDKDALKGANMTTVRSLFDGASSFAHSVANRATKIYSEAASAGSATSTYTNKGSYANAVTGAMLDGFM